MARSPPTGEYVFDFAVVIFGVRLLLPRGFRAQANSNIHRPFQRSSSFERRRST